MRVVIIGCGWLGKQLAFEFLKKNMEVIGTTKSTDPQISNPNFQWLQFDSEKDKIEQLNLDSNDLLVISLKPSMHFLGILEQLKAFQKVLVFSSTSIYGNQGIVDESTLPLPETTNGHYLVEAENRFPYSFIRLAGLVGPGRNPNRFYQAKENLDFKKEVINLAHSEDICKILVQLVLENKVPKKLNLVCPYHPFKTEFYGQLHPNKKVQTEGKATGKTVQSIYTSKLGIEYKIVNLLDLKNYDETTV